MEITKPSAKSVEKNALRQTSKIGWIDKHADLIAKLEAQYQQPIESQIDSVTDRYFSVSIAGFNLLIPHHISSEILEDNNIYQIPLCPDWLIGACNVRGDIAPILNFNKILCGQDTDIDNQNDKILILNFNGNLIGMFLKQLPVVVQFEKEEIVKDHSNFPVHFNSFITTAYLREEKPWFNLDFVSLIESITN